MPNSVVYNGSSYLIPVTGDNSWGATTTAYLTALATGSLTKGGGAFTLASEVNFGSTYGLKLAYLKTESATLAAAGFLRLANNSDSISWRNAANSADLALLVNGSNALQFNSISLADISSAQTLTNKTMSGSSNTFTNLPATGLTGLVPPANGGTGVANNAASTVTISGAYATTLTVTGATGVTLPTTGTLATLAGVESPTNKTFDHTSTMTGVEIASFTPDGTHTLTAPAVTDTLVGLAATQTLTNKTLTSPAVTGLTGTLSNPVLSGYEDFTEIVKPSSPTAGVLRLYSKAGDNLFTLNSAGTETQVGSGSGQKNYLQASTSTATGWLSFNGSGATAASVATISTDTLAADLPRALTTQTGVNVLPVAVSSSVNAGTFTATHATPTVLTFTATGIQSGYVIYVANSGGALPTGLSAATPYWCTMQTATTAKISTSYANYLAGTFVATSSTGTGTQYYGWNGTVAKWTLDAADYNVKLQAQWAQNILSGAAGDWQVDVLYNSASSYTYNTYTRCPLSTDTASTTVLPNLEGTFKTTFDTPGLAAPYMEIRFQNITATTHALVFSDLIVGPGVGTQGAAVTNWYAGTAPSGGWINTGPTNASVTVMEQRVGTSVFVDYLITATGTSASFSNLVLNLPADVILDTTVMTNDSANVLFFGNGEIDKSGVGWSGIWGMSNSSTTSIQVYYMNTTSDPDFRGAITNSAPEAWNTTTAATCLHFRTIALPNANWSGSGTVNVVQNDVLYYYGTGGTWGTSSAVTTAQGPGGVLGGTTTPSGSSFAYTITPTYPIPVGVTPVVETSPDGIHWTTGTNTQTPDTTEALRYDGTNYYGAGAQVNTSGNIVVTFGKYAGGSTSGTWTGTWYWRVMVAAPGQAIGFGIVQPGLSAGLVSATGLPGNQVTTYSANSYPTNYVGEYLEGSVAEGSVALTSSTTTYDIISGGLTLSAGTWDITGCVSFDTASGTTLAYAQGWIGTASGNSSTGRDLSRNFTAIGPNTASDTVVIPLPTWRVSISTSTTYYLKANASFAVSTVTGGGTIRATRVL